MRHSPPSQTPGSGQARPLLPRAPQASSPGMGTPISSMDHPPKLLWGRPQPCCPSQGCCCHGAVALTVRMSRLGHEEVTVAEQRAHRRTSTGERVQLPAGCVTNTFSGVAEAWVGKGRASPLRPPSPNCCHLPGCPPATSLAWRQQGEPSAGPSMSRAASSCGRV